MKKLLIYLKDYRKESILAPLFKMLEASFELIVPLVVTAIIDVGIRERDSGYILKMCLVMVALGLIGLLCSVTAQYFAAKAAAGFGTRVRHRLFSHIQTFSFSEIDQVGTATLITRMTSDINQVQSGVNMVLRLFLRSPFIVFGAMIMAFTIDVEAALIFVVTIPLLSLVVFGVMAVSIPLYRKVQERLDKVLGITRENLTGARVIRAFHKEEEEKSRFEEGLENLTAMQNHVGRISAFLNPVTYVIINGATIFLLYTGALQVDAGALTQGEVVALVNYMSQILVELIKLANLIVTITKAVACGNRVESVLEIQSTMPRETGEIRRKSSLRKETTESGTPTERRNDTDFQRQEKQPAVQFSHVGLTYEKAGAESLTDIDFSVNPGETVGIIGGTGSGKTSLVHLIPRFYDATRGEVLINGRNVKEFPGRAAPEGGNCHAAGGIISGNHPGKSLLGQRGRRRGRTDGGPGHRPGKRSGRRKGRKAGSLCGTGRKEFFRRSAAAPYHCTGAGKETGNPDPGRQRFGPGLCHRRQTAQSHPGNGRKSHGFYCVSADLFHPACR